MRRRGRAMLAAVVASALSACTSLPGPGAQQSAPPSQTPAATQPAPRSTESVTVKDKQPATLSGTEPTRISYDAPGDIAVVATLECPDCTGKSQLSNVDQGRVLIDATDAVVADALVSVYKYDRSATLEVNATGPWTLTLTSWNDLKEISPKRLVKVTGPRVFLLKTPVKGSWRVTYKGKDKDDQLLLRTFPLPNTNTGVTQVMNNDQVWPLDLPAIIEVRTRGTWSLTQFSGNLA